VAEAGCVEMVMFSPSAANYLFAMNLPQRKADHGAVLTACLLTDEEFKDANS
jgi:hypothetical protein